ncbi:MAG: XisI protein [Saprospiraceae bacterium]
MGKLKQYKAAILSIIEEHALNKPVNLEDVDNQIITDEERGHYQLVSLGWEGRAFSYAVIYHFDIKPDGKVWIQANNTDIDVAEELMQKGVAREDIVVGFQHPAYRPYTGYAVA